MTHARTPLIYDRDTGRTGNANVVHLSSAHRGPFDRLHGTDGMLAETGRPSAAVFSATASYAAVARQPVQSSVEDRWEDPERWDGLA